MQEQIPDTLSSAQKSKTTMPQKLNPSHSPRIAGNTATGTLKLIALILMIIDHVGAVFFTSATGNYIPELRIIGRLAFPLYAWCMVVGAEYTHSMPKYILRILVVGAIAQPIYAWALHHSLFQFSIYATLFLGLAGIWGIRLNRYGSRYWAPALVIFISLIVKVDYNFQGVLFIMLLYLCRERRSALIGIMVAFCLFWGYTSGSQLTTVLGITLPKTVDWLPHSKYFFASLFKMQTCAMLATPLMVIKMKNVHYPRGKVCLHLAGHEICIPWDLGKIIGYAAYPGHLLIIGIVRTFMGV